MLPNVPGPVETIRNVPSAPNVLTSHTMFGPGRRHDGRVIGGINGCVKELVALVAAQVTGHVADVECTANNNHIADTHEVAGIAQGVDLEIGRAFEIGVGGYGQGAVARKAIGVDAQDQRAAGGIRHVDRIRSRIDGVEYVV